MTEIKAKDIMTGKVITIKEDSSINELSDLLLKQKISGVPVVNKNNELVGVVTEADIVYQNTDLHFPTYLKLLDGIIYLESLNKFKRSLEKHMGTKVKDIMTSPAITVGEDEEVSEIANLMVRKNINRVPVVEENGNLVGIITRADIIKSMGSKKQ